MNSIQDLEPAKVKEKAIEDFREYVSSGKVAFWQQFNMDIVIGCPKNLKLTVGWMITNTPIEWKDLTFFVKDIASQGIGKTKNNFYNSLINLL